MHDTSRPTVWRRGARGGLLAGILAVCLLPGCGEHKSHPPSVTEPPAVQVIQPQVRDIVHVVGQPSFVESYERTSVYPKVRGYIKQWYKDIGDRVKKGEVLCTLRAPEYDEDWETKKATVQFDLDRILLAKKVVKVAEKDVEAAEARLKEAKAILEKYQSQVDRWAIEVRRLRREVKEGTVDPQVLLESENQFRASTAAREEAKATIEKAEAELLSKKATLEEDIVDVKVAESRKDVAVSNAKLAKAWVDYLTLTAPYDGVVIARNANTDDLVLPLTGDPTADHNAPHTGPGGKAAPIYVIDRTDVVRIFVDVPDRDANYVHEGSKASVLIDKFSKTPISCEVTRDSWALNFTSRTRRVEIDLHNSEIPAVYRDLGQHQRGKGVYDAKHPQILPGMYAYAKVVVRRPKVLAVPVSALVTSGDSSYYWRYENGHAVKTEVQTGVSDGEWIEITNKQVPVKDAGDEPWAPVARTEKIILGDLSILTEGGSVKVTEAEKPEEAKVAEATTGQRRTKSE